jgi:hypothetical protein
VALPFETASDTSLGLIPRCDERSIRAGGVNMGLVGVDGCAQTAGTCRMRCLACSVRKSAADCGTAAVASKLSREIFQVLGSIGGADSGGDGARFDCECAGVTMQGSLRGAAASSWSTESCGSRRKKAIQLQVGGEAGLKWQIYDAPSWRQIQPCAK